MQGYAVGVVSFVSRYVFPRRCECDVHCHVSRGLVCDLASYHPATHSCWQDEALDSAPAESCRSACEISSIPLIA